MITQGGAFISRLEATVGVAPTITIYNKSNTSLLTAWVVPLIESFQITPVAVVNKQMTVNYTGDVVAVHWSGVYLEAEIRVKSFGSTLADAIASSHGLEYGFTAVTSGFIVVPMAGFADAYNVAGGSAPETSRWIYTGGPVDIRGGDAAGRVLTFSRFPKIVGGTAVVS